VKALIGMKIRAAVAAFSAGWTLMMMEILGGRLMAPWFGQSVQQWGALIGCVMAAMAAGYWFGGRTQAPGRTAGTCLAFGALWAAATPALGKALLAFCALLGPEAGMVAGAAALMAAPAFALAAVSPACAAALADADADGAGAAAGRAGALSTAGSIGGTFFAAFIAVPEFGVALSYAAAAVIAAAGALAVGYRPGFPAAALTGLLATAGLSVERAHIADVLLSVETKHSTIEVTEQDGVVTLTAGGYGVVQSKRRRDGGPTGMYYDALPVLPALAAGGERSRVLVLGVAGGSGLTALAAAWPRAAVLGVELDPGMTAAGRAHFGLDAPVIHEDARRFAETDAGVYDVVLTDVYSGSAVPFHAASKEYFQAAARRLAPGGVAAVNACRCGGGDALPGALAATMAAVFPSVLAADAPGGNVLLLAWREPGIGPEEARRRLAEAPGGPATVLVAETLHTPPAGFPVLTDDRSDVEFRTGAQVRR
jgi:spermidine synthase